MRILIADKLSSTFDGKLERAGHVLLSRPGLKEEALSAALLDFKPEVLVVRSTRVTTEMFAGARTLELVVRAGAGYDNIDVEAASGRGVFVANCPGRNAAAVAELTIGLLLSLDRSIPDNVIDARNGVWNKAGYSKAAGVKGRTLGIVGMGNIGTEVARRALALQMKVVAWSRSLTDETARSLGVRRMDTVEDVAAAADAVTLHIAGTSETAAIAGKAFFEAMKPGAFFINTSRSSVVDEPAFQQAVEEKGVRAALDVFSDEPAYKEGDFSHPLANQEGIYLTHHIGASTVQAQEEIADEAARVILTYADSNVVPNCVNISRVSDARYQLTVRHLDKVGVLAFVLNEMSKAHWNVQEMQNLIFADGEAACAVIQFDGVTDESVLGRIQANSDILALTVIDL